MPVNDSGTSSPEAPKSVAGFLNEALNLRELAAVFCCSCILFSLSDFMRGKALEPFGIFGASLQMLRLKSCMKLACNKFSQSWLIKQGAKKAT